MGRRLALSAAVVAMALGAVACESAPPPTPVALVLDSGTAFSILGHSCGGIHQQAFATGFDASGFPTGAVYLQTRCSTGGRGGGTATYSAWAGVTWDFAATVRSATTLGAAPSDLSPTFSATDAYGDRVYNELSATNVAPADCSAGNTTYCSYKAYLTVPVPSAPTGVAVSQTGDSLQVTWHATGHAITSSTVTATPTAGGTTLTATTTGAATTATVDGVQPSTEYSVSVTSTDISGTSPASSAVLITTHAATLLPSAPTGVVAAWTGTNIVASWTAAVPGDSPVTDYEVQVAQYDPTGPPVATDAGTATSVTLTGYDTTLDWSVRVRALNAKGWGPWSAAVIVPAAN